MELPDSLGLALALVAGLAVGVLFFGGLWWTVLRGLISSRPAIWFFSSLMIRMGVAIVSFYFVSIQGLAPIAAWLLGFLVARIGVSRVTRPPKESLSRFTEEGSHPT